MTLPKEVKIERLYRPSRCYTGNELGIYNRNIIRRNAVTQDMLHNTCPKAKPEMVKLHVCLDYWTCVTLVLVSEH